VKKQPWIIVFISIVFAISGCASKPKFGAIDNAKGSFMCYTVENYEYQNYQAKVYDGSGNLLATVDNLEVKESTSRYSDGWCNLKVSALGLPLGNGPYKIEYLVNGQYLTYAKLPSLMEY
jgi:hypothetical protein